MQVVCGQLQGPLTGKPHGSCKDSYMEATWKLPGVLYGATWKLHEILTGKPHGSCLNSYMEATWKLSELLHGSYTEAAWTPVWKLHGSCMHEILTGRRHGSCQDFLLESCLEAAGDLDRAAAWKLHGLLLEAAFPVGFSSFPPACN